METCFILLRYTTCLEISELWGLTYRWESDPWRGGGTPLYKLYRYVPPQRVWVLSHFGLKTGIDFDRYGLKSGMVFKGTRGANKRICLFNSKWIVEKEKYPKYIIRAEFYQFLNSLLMRSLITIQQRSEMGINGFLESRSENGCGKRNILVWNWVRIWGTGRHTPTSNSEKYPPPGESDRCAELNGKWRD